MRENSKFIRLSKQGKTEELKIVFNTKVRKDEMQYMLEDGTHLIVIDRNGAKIGRIVEHDTPLSNWQEIKIIEREKKDTE